MITVVAEEGLEPRHADMTPPPVVDFISNFSVCRGYVPDRKTARSACQFTSARSAASNSLASSPLGKRWP
jgi:hypothetical protein